MTRKSRANDFTILNGREYVSVRVAAVVCGVTQATYNNWCRDENAPPKDEVTGMVPVEKLGHWIRAEQVLKPGRGGSGFPYLPNVSKLYGNSSFGKEAPETRLKRLQADKVQLELDVASGKLIPAEDVESGWVGILTRVRAKLLRIPVAVTPLIVGKSDAHDVQEKIADAVREVLEELSDDVRDD